MAEMPGHGNKDFAPAALRLAMGLIVQGQIIPGKEQAESSNLFDTALIPSGRPDDGQYWALLLLFLSSSR